ncbi:MAG: lamin tail domain-containing protein [Planctomycetota bacterium]
MLLSTLLMAAAIAPQGPTGTSPTLFINEFSYDDSSTDDFEFVEIFNGGSTPIDLTGWILESRDPSGLNFSLALGTSILQPGDFFVVGNAAVPNVDLVRPSNFLENDNESLTLIDPSSNVVDTLIYESNKGIFNPALVQGEGIWDNRQLVEDGSFISISRYMDGYQQADNGLAFGNLPWTPGAPNHLGTGSYFDDFDALVPPADAPRWNGSFKNLRAIDPTLVGPAIGVNNLNPNAITASPQGGNAAIFWDETGGGNFAVHLGAPSLASSFEAWVYLASAATPTAGEHESWSIGVGGSCGDLYNTPDPSGALGAGFIANGNTGYSWTYQALSTGVTLYLIDHNNGAWGGSAGSAPTILASIPITSGVNDGWQRLLIDVSSGTLTARFGGTLGNPDGTLFSFSVPDLVGSVYLGYRELVALNSTLRPITLDAITINTCAASHNTDIGHGSPGNAGVPALTSGLAQLGNPFTLTADFFVANDTAVFLFGLQTPAIDLASTAGALAGAELYLFILDYLGSPTDGSGTATASFTVPALPELCGGELAFQALQIDPTVPAALPISLTQGRKVRVGL